MHKLTSLGDAQQELERLQPHAPRGGLHGKSGFVDGSLHNARFCDPSDIAAARVEDQATLFVSDRSNHAVRRVKIESAHEDAGTVETIACRPSLRPTSNQAASASTSASASASLPTAPRAAAPASPWPVLLPLTHPGGLALSPASDWLVLSDSGSHILRRLWLRASLAAEAKEGGAEVYAGGGGSGGKGEPEDNEGDDDELTEEQPDEYASNDQHTAPHSRPSTAGSTRSTTAASVKGLPLTTPIPALSAHFSRPAGLYLDSSACVWVCDRGNGRLKRLTPTRLLSTLRTGEEEVLGAPQCVLVDARGNVVWTEAGGHCIRRMTPDGRIGILAGSPRQSGFRDGNGREARFSSPYGLALVPDHMGGGNAILVSDEDNHAIRIVSERGEVRTIAGRGAIGDFATSLTATPSPSEDMEAEEGFVDGSGAAARFFRPRGLAFLSDEDERGGGTLFVCDSGNHAIRSIRVEAIGATQDESEERARGFAALQPQEPFPSARLLYNDRVDDSSSASRDSTPRMLNSSSQFTLHSARPTTARPATARPATARPLTAAPRRPASSSGATGSAASADGVPSLPPDASEWTRMDVAFWLLDLSPALESYVAAFLAARIDGAALMQRNFEQQLTSLIPSSTHRRTVLRALRALQLRSGQADDDEDDQGESDGSGPASGASSASSSRAASASLSGRPSTASRGARPATASSLTRPMTARPSTASRWRRSPSPTGPIVNEIDEF